MPVSGKCNKKMKAAIYDPYLDTLGGGEKYTLTVAQVMLQLGWSVDLFWSKDPVWLQKARKRFLLDLKGLNIVPNLFSSSGSVFSRLQKIKSVTGRYDYFFFLSDGSIPFLFAKNNLLHFQVPFHSLSFSKTQKLLNRLKLARIKVVITNSAFTKKLVDQTYGVKSQVLYPPIDVDNFKPQKKQNLILSVARFEQTLHTKRQDVLISAFKKLYDQDKPDWKLILAGSSRQDSAQNSYLSQLRRFAQNYPIEFVVNQDFSVIQKLYAQSKIFWHAAGFGVDETKEPQLVEHFGMVAVEAMAAGSVPVVVKKGGIKEVIENEKNGYLWENQKELIAYTRLLMSGNQIREKVSLKAQKRARDFSNQNFVDNLKNLLATT
jgi:glycosyltransferase involved in cell wall biosynthesis